jgi:hypothetical protein
MSTTSSTGPTTGPSQPDGRPPSTGRKHSDAAVGLTVGAATIMVMGGGFQALQGLVALVNDTFYVVGEEYVFEFDVTTWGWIHLLVGILVAVAGLFLFQGATWARAVAVAVACLSIITNFMWAPYYPVWSLVIIAFDVFVIWAVTAHGRDIAA